MRMIIIIFYLTRNETLLYTWLPTSLFTLLDTWLPASLLVNSHESLRSYGEPIYKTFRHPLILWDHNSTQKPEARISENCWIYGENGWVAEVEIQDRMRLWWIRIRVGVNRCNTCFPNTQINQLVYSQLEVATIGWTAYHIIKKYEDDKDGYGAWNDLCEWYDGGAVRNKTSDSLRSKLESYRITSASNAAQYINNFLTSFR